MDLKSFLAEEKLTPKGVITASFAKFGDEVQIDLAVAFKIEHETLGSRLHMMGKLVAVDEKSFTVMFVHLELLTETGNGPYGKIEGKPWKRKITWEEVRLDHHTNEPEVKHIGMYVV